MDYDYKRELDSLQAMLDRSERVVGGSPESVVMTERAYNIRAEELRLRSLQRSLERSEMEGLAYRLRSPSIP